MLAREAIAHAANLAHQAASHPEDRAALTKVELFGLAALMLKTMAETADHGFLGHGGPVWKVFGKALWQAQQTATDPVGAVKLDIQ